MNHLEFSAAESSALEPTSFERWIEKAEKLIGHHLDGDDSAASRAMGTADGYSIDEALDMFRAGKNPHDYVVMVATRERYRKPKAA